MLRRKLFCALSSVAVGLLAHGSARLAEAKPEGDGPNPTGSASISYISYAAQEAAALVQQALDAESGGNASLRRELLEKAIAADPDCAAARWQLGQVKFEGVWRTVEQVGDLVASDQRWADYRRHRDAMEDSAAGHAELALWCESQGLANEGRFHWTKVLAASPGDDQAMEQLKLKSYEGGLYTDEQIAARKQAAYQAKADFKRLKPKFVRLCRTAVKRSAGREAALEEIRQTTDPAAMYALDYAVAQAARDVTEKACLDVRLAAVSALKNMSTHEATLRLVNCAVWAPQSEVRTAAAAALKTRPATDFIPTLMASLAAPMEAAVDVFVAPDGTVRVTETLFREGPESDRAHVRSSNFESAADFPAFDDSVDTARALQVNFSRAANQVAATQNQVAAANAEAAVVNQRIESVLRTTSDLTADFEPSVWWQAWQEYNELSYTDEKPVDRSYEDQTYVYTPPTTCECFAEGTEVWTQSGPKPIEIIRVGDLVLAMNPHTGEVGYRPVVETSSRKAPGTVHLDVAGETIVATPGHRFWVNRRGWQMAKFLGVSHELHALGGAVPIATVAAGADAECFNLIVDDFHTFFVGKAKLLVQDKTCPQPTFAAIPGSARVREAVADGQQFGVTASAESPFDE